MRNVVREEPVCTSLLKYVRKPAINRNPAWWPMEAAMEETCVSQVTLHAIVTRRNNSASALRANLYLKESGRTRDQGRP